MQLVATCFNSSATERLCRGTGSEERGRTTIVMQMWKVEATRRKRDEPRGSITLVFHHEPESICLKIRKGAGLISDLLRA